MTQHLDVVDPADESTVAQVPCHDTAHLDTAVAAARHAVRDWGALGAEGRHEILAAAVRRALPEAARLGELQSREMGQPLSMSQPLTEAALHGIAAATESALSYPFLTPLEGSTFVSRQPLGVGALITPWNFPLPVALEGLAALLAGGNTVVWKPSERCPLSALAVAEALDLPDGVLSVVIGEGDLGAALAGHPGTNITVFTGSVPVGRSVGAANGALLRPVVMELGGKDPVIVDAGVDIAWAARTVAFATFWNTGQVCTSMERIYVHQDVADEFLDALVAETEKLVVGSPLDLGTQLGPLAGVAPRDRVAGLLQDAVGKGARVLTGGGVSQQAGAWMEPTVLLDVDASMRLATEEIFGPLAPVEVVTSFEDGLRRAQQGDFALCATVLSDNPEHIARAGEIPAAVVWVNEWQGGVAGMTYAPAKDSGIGTVGTLDTFTRPMAVHVGPVGADSPMRPTWG